MPVSLLVLLWLFAETLLMMKVGDALGFWSTLGLIALTGLVGVALAWREGFRALNDAVRRLQVGEAPGEEALDGLALFIAGALLLLPGFLTDAVGLLLLTPPPRDVLKRALKRSARRDAASAVVIPGFGSIHRQGPPDVVLRPDQFSVDDDSPRRPPES